MPPAKGREEETVQRTETDGDYHVGSGVCSAGWEGPEFVRKTGVAKGARVACAGARCTCES